MGFFNCTAEADILIQRSVNGLIRISIARVGSVVELTRKTCQTDTFERLVYIKWYYSQIHSNHNQNAICLFVRLQTPVLQGFSRLLHWP